MATGTAPGPLPPPPPPTAEAARQDAYIGDQIDRTRLQVKLVDLASSLMILAAGCLAYVLSIVIIDHWISPLSVWGRAFALVVLLGGVVWYCVRVVAPLMLGRISSVYAAQSIEQYQPTLKNSLINFLLLRDDRRRVLGAVYDAVQQRAADDLTHVPLEHAVDRTKLIRIGYVLAGVFVVCGIYTLLSPKDLFQTVARVAAPWADISRPARVTIEEVTPGDVTVYQGERLEISAKLSDVGEEDQVIVVYTTADGQTLEREVPMVLDEKGFRYVCKLPEGEQGIEQPLTYSVRAGDAESNVYNVQVEPAPTIIVQKVRYEFPKYTQLPSEEVLQEADIQGREGTIVTIYAEANREISSAHLELSPGASSRNLRSADVIDGMEARFHFTLKLNKQGVPEHSTYQLRFTSGNDVKNDAPILHTINVLPDLAPRVWILKPERRKVEVPVNGRLEIEVRAMDPDFKLSSVKLASQGEVIDVALLKPGTTHQGQFTGKFFFRPQKHQIADAQGTRALVPGDRVRIWATAADNRRMGKPGGFGFNLQPNVAQSEGEYWLHIIAPDANAEASRSGDPKQDDPNDPNSEQQKSDQPGDDNPNDPTNPETPEQAKPEDDPTKPEPSDKPEDDPKKPNDQQKEDDAADKQDGDTEQGDQGEPQNSGNQEQSGENSKEQEGNGGQSEQQQGGDSEQQGDQSQGEGTAGEQGTAGSENSGENSQSASGGSEQGDGSGEPTGTDGSDDGNALEKIRQHMKEQQEAGKGSSSESSSNESGSGDSQGESTDGGTPSDNSQPSNGSGDNQQNSNQPNDGSGDAGNESSDSSNGSDSQETTGEPKSGDGEGEPAPNQGNQPSQGDAPKGGDPSDNEGGQTNGEQSTQPEQGSENSGGGEKQPGQGDNGESGGGAKSDDPSGAAEAQGDNKQSGQESNDSPQGNSNDEQGAQTPSNSNRQSPNSANGESGDRSGNGEKGPGQSSKQPGHDSAGNSSAADDGAGTAEQKGAGDGRTGGAGDETADDKTGHSAESDGPGTGQKQGTGDQSGGKPGDTPEPGDPSQKPGDPQGQGRPGKPGNSGQGDAINPGGKGRDPSTDNHQAEGREPGADKADVDYAREQTDLVLEYLKDQKDNPDQELLDKLGNWSKDDLNNLVNRWQDLKSNATKSEEGQRELDQTLRSLGLSSSNGKTRSDQATGERTTQSDRGTRSRTLGKYEAQYKAFLKSRSNPEQP